MSKTIKYYSKNSRVLKAVLSNWIEATKAYASKWGWEDVHWWYGERTAIGFLAAAVWKAEEGVALEEYRTEKKKNGSVSQGRCDLHFRIGKKPSYIAEAKKIKSTITKEPESAIQEIKTGLDLACEDAKKLTGRETKLGIVFVEFHAKPEDCPRLLELWSEQAKKKPFYKHAAWIFPEEAITPKKLKEAKSFKKRKFTPGTAIFIRQV